MSAYTPKSAPEKEYEGEILLENRDVDSTLFDSVEAPRDDDGDPDQRVISENRRLLGVLRELGNPDHRNNSQLRPHAFERSVEKSDNALLYKLGYYIPVVNLVLSHNGLAKTGAIGKANLIWNAKMKDMEQFTKLGPHQKVNHFPNSLQLGRKDCLNKNMFHMQSKFAKDFCFLPRSYILPQEEPVLLDVI